MNGSFVPFIESGPNSQVAAFLASQPDWRQGLGPGWKGTKFLGKGGYDIVGLWEYKGDPMRAPAVTKVVVKVAEDTDQDIDKNIFRGKTAYDEGNILAKLSKVPTNHVIKQYGGNRVGDKFLDMDYVVRIYLEFCPGGDLDQFIAREGEAPNHLLDEADLWAIFNCLAIGALAMHRGTELPTEVRRQGRKVNTEICHYDIKPDNILLGFRDEHHARLPICKYADFGEALEEETCGMPERMAHPFRHIPIQHPRKGACSNTFQIGAVMNCLLVGNFINFNADDTSPPTICTDNHWLRRGYNHSIGLNTDDMRQRYSDNLRTLIMECMMREATFRPKSTDLAIRTAAALQTADFVAKNRPILPPSVAAIPMVGLLQPEPPLEWDIDTSEYDIAQRDYVIVPDIPSPTPDTGGFLGIKLTEYLPTWSPFAASHGSSTSTTPPRSTPATSVSSQGPGVGGAFVVLGKATPDSLEDRGRDWKT
ncbi:Serine threonine-kinase GIN4 [Hyphodiscus hymeniophilus]|uniref:non-specific serine/threonine protein kinase n=1 Tax=Hyphodiscus hymeniophilus TaxID=353542 RepID=A0A9P7AVC2_9HELO|nr:Serine threonine-kinase GIN4 [Hyphodiscus hymeniophilus]